MNGSGSGINIHITVCNFRYSAIQSMPVSLSHTGGLPSKLTADDVQANVRELAKQVEANLATKEAALFDLKKILVAKGEEIVKTTDGLKAALGAQETELKKSIAASAASVLKSARAADGALSQRLDKASMGLKTLESGLASKESNLRHSITASVNALTTRIGKAEGTLRTLPSG